MRKRFLGLFNRNLLTHAAKCRDVATY